MAADGTELRSIKDTGFDVFKISESWSSGASADSETSSLSLESQIRKKNKFPPVQASKWDTKDLRKIGIVYDDVPTDIAKFLEVLKFSKPSPVPKMCKKLVELTGRVWSFSGDSSMLAITTDCREKHKIIETPETCRKKRSEVEVGKFIDEQLKLVEKAKENFNEMYNDIEKQLSEELRKGILVMDYFRGWRIGIIKFWSFYVSILKRLLKTPYQMEGRFTQLFELFCRIFHLEPERGDFYKEEICIGSTPVRGNPDVRFLDSEAQKVLIVTEVSITKKCDAENFIHTHIDSRVLGQHGIQLLMELRDSVFSPRVIGVMCIGTQLVFTSLRVGVEHLQEIEVNNGISSHQSTIIYTQPYDFLLDADRRKIYEALFWFGVVQGSAKGFCY